MATPTYDLIETTTMTSGGATISNIPQDYKDLVLSISGDNGGPVAEIGMKFNGVSLSKYSYVLAAGNGSNTFSSNSSSKNYARLQQFGLVEDDNPIALIIQIINYSDTDKNIVYLARNNSTSSSFGGAEMIAGRLQDNSAVTQIEFLDTVTGTRPLTGLKLSLYGIAG